MAKKSVASLQSGSKRLAKAVKMVKSPITGSYTFVESIMIPEQVDSFLKYFKSRPEPSGRLFLFMYICE
jgi:hypothetical protein